MKTRAPIPGRDVTRMCCGSHTIVIMTQRHPISSGCMMFITTNTRHRAPIFEHGPYAREVIETLFRTKELHPFLLFGFVVMHDHCHLLLQVRFPEKISTIMNVWKGMTSLNIGLGRIWQPRYDMQVPEAPNAVLRYIHNNPVSAAYCESPEEYAWSSANHRWNIDPLPM